LRIVVRAKKPLEMRISVELKEHPSLAEERNMEAMWLSWDPTSNTKKKNENAWN